MAVYIMAQVVSWFVYLIKSIHVICDCRCYWSVFFKLKTACEMRISDCRSDVCSSDLEPVRVRTADLHYGQVLAAELRLPGRRLVSLADHGGKQEPLRRALNQDRLVGEEQVTA